jgi:hypothetical protein
MRCLTCNTDLIDIHYRDTNNSYILEKDNSEVMFSCDKSISDNNSNTYKYLYCEECEKIIDYSSVGDITLILEEHYNNHLDYNIIHKFTNTTCRYCSNILQKGYFTNTISDDVDTLVYCYPEGYKNNIHIYNEDTDEKIKDIEIDLVESYISEKEIDKKIIYCTDCNYFIANNLKEIYKL